MYFLSLSFSEGNNETSDEAAGGGVGVGGGSSPPSALELAKMQDEMLEILLSTETAPDGTWKKTWSSSRYCSRSDLISNACFSECKCCMYSYFASNGNILI